jgi:manganese/zinc/iron transport system permease protein
MAIMALLTLLFVLFFYKELKLSTFDAALAATLGFRPGLLNYALMVMVSLVAVGAFDAVGSILVIAFFIIPPAAAYLLTDRLPRMLIYSSLIGAAGAYFGYDLARGSFLGLIQMSGILALLNELFDLGLVETWDSSISASMVLMIFFFFWLSWTFSPKYGLVSTLVRRRNQRRNFDYQVVLGHILHHRGEANEGDELAASTLHEHFRWPASKMRRVLRQLRTLNLVQIEADQILLTPRGERRVTTFRQTQLTNESAAG